MMTDMRTSSPILALLVCLLLSACAAVSPTAAVLPSGDQGASETAVAPSPESLRPSPTATDSAPILADTGQQEATGTAPPSGAGSPAAGTDLSQTGCPVTQAPAIDAGAVIDLGPAPGLPTSQAGGEPLIILGTVYAGDCTPLAGAALNVWQTDAAGEYGPGHGSDEMQCCYLQGSVTTDSNGHFQLNTIKPGHYKGQASPPPAHIHVELSHPDMQPSMSEIVFAGDPYLPAGRSQGLVVVSLETAADADQRTTFLRGVADFTMQAAAPKGGPGNPEGATPPGLRTFQVIPEQSEAAYMIREKFIFLPVKTSAIAVTRQLSGALTLDLAGQPALQSFAVSADLRGLASDDAQRDEKLADRWLVTDEFPVATFSAGRIESLNTPYQAGQPASFTLHGDMTIRDISRPVAFQVTARITGDTLLGSAQGSLKMSDFGIDPPSLLDFVVVEDEVLISVNLVAKDTH